MRKILEDKALCKCTKCQKQKRLERQMVKDLAEKHKGVGARTKNCERPVVTDSVDVKVDVIPDVLLKRLKDNNRTTFEIELDVAANPNCKVVKKEVYDEKNCKLVTKYVLLVESDVKLGCSPKITQIASNPYAKYEMDVIVDTEQNVKTHTN